MLERTNKLMIVQPEYERKGHEVIKVTRIHPLRTKKQISWKTSRYILRSCPSEYHINVLDQSNYGMHHMGKYIWKSEDSSHMCQLIIINLYERVRTNLSDRDSLCV